MLCWSFYNSFNRLLCGYPIPNDDSLSPYSVLDVTKSRFLYYFCSTRSLGVFLCTGCPGSKRQAGTGENADHVHSGKYLKKSMPRT